MEPRRDGDALDRASTDFGHIVTRRPAAVAVPATIAELAESIAYARAHGLHACARGQGHTTGGQALREGGLIVDLARLDAIAVDARAGVARCGGGARWSDVVRATLAQGLTPPVLTDYLGLSVGGTLSVGGIGGQSFRYGLQVDQTRELVVVTGDGRERRASATADAALFDVVRGGGGRAGVIAEAELALVRAPERVRVRHLPYRSLAPFLADQVRLIESGRFDYVLGNIPAVDGAWTFSLEVVEYLPRAADARLDDLACEPGAVEAEELTYAAYVTRLDAMVAAMQASGTWGAAHPWLDVFVGAAAGADYIGACLADLPPREVGDGYVMTYPVRRAACTAPMVRLPDEPHAFLFDVLATAADAATTSACLARVERLGDLALAQGSTMYPIGSLPMTPPRLARQLGPMRARLAEVTARVDPEGVLGYDSTD